MYAQMKVLLISCFSRQHIVSSIICIVALSEYCIRLSDVLKRAKSRDIKIELDEAREVAREEVIHLRIEEERKRVHSQMNDALKALDVEYDMKLIEIAKKERLTKQVDAATVIYSAVYRWYKEKDVNTSLS